MSQPVSIDTEVMAPGATELATFIRCQENPSIFCREILGVTPEKNQEKILLAVMNEVYTAAHTGHGIGKTALGSWVLLWFLFTRAESKVITTAPTWRQVKDLLWTEIHKWIRKAEFEKMGWTYPYDLLTTKLSIREEWYATGESTDDPYKLEGYHAPAIMYIVDEAKGVPDSHYDAMDGGMTTEEAKMLLLSTPGNTAGKLYNVCSGRENSKLKKAESPYRWKVVHVNAEDSENVNQTYIKGRAAVWGAKSATYRMRVKGDFVDVSDDTLVTPAEVEACQEIEVENPKKARRIVAVDVARYGSDRSVVALREGDRVVALHKYDQMDTVDLTDAVYDDIIKDFDPHEIWVDTTGVGAGVFDNLIRKKGMRDKCYEFVAGALPNDTEQYLNKRAEVYHGVLREKIKQQLIQLPKDELLEGQLASMKFEFRPKGQFTVVKLKSKEEMRRAGEDSPDEADAVSMLFASDAAEGEGAGQGVWF